MRATAPEPAEQRLQRLWMSRGALACTLLPLAALFGAIGALRRALYRWGWWRAQTLPVPVIVVGNLVAGGAGKTPAVMAVPEIVREMGMVEAQVEMVVAAAAQTTAATVIQVEAKTTHQKQRLMLQRLVRHKQLLQKVKTPA